MSPPREKLYPLSEAVELATGCRPHPATTHRWRQRGISGVRLETVRVGGRRLCSVESVHRFVAATTAATDGASAPARTSHQRQAAIDRAEAELDRAGI